MWAMWSLWAVAALYVLVQIGFVVGIVVLSRKKDRRYKSAVDEAPPGFEPTGEVFADASTGGLTRVYYHPQSGERLYVKEIKRDTDE